MNYVGKEKPLRIKCPQCGFDMSVDMNHIEDSYQVTLHRLHVIESQIAELKASRVPKNTKKYRQLIQTKAKTVEKLTYLKRVRSRVIDKSELQKLRIFCQSVKDIVGLEKYEKLMRDAEDTMFYNDYDMAIQKAES